MSALNRPQSPEDFGDRIESERPRLPKRLVQCADFVAQNPHRIALGTIAEISSDAGVSPSAMMRFAQAMGFEGYTDMQRLYRTAINRELPDYTTRLKSLQDSGAGSPSALLAEFIEAGRNSLENLASSVDPRILDRSVERLARAEMIHVIGLRRAFPVAAYMAYAFEKMSIPAILHQKTGKLDFSHALREGDVVIAVTFAPYSPETLEFVGEAGRRGVPIVMITDKRSALPSRGEVLPILVKEVDFGAFRSLSATLTVAISLAVSVGASRERKK